MNEINKRRDSAANINGTDKNIPKPTSVKTVYLDSDNIVNAKNSVLGIILLFFCIFAVCAGLILCVSDSFDLEIDFADISWVLFISLLFFTAIYFLPSGLFTLIAFLPAAGYAVFYVINNLEYIGDAAYYTLNLCLFRIIEAGYLIGGGMVDFGLAETVSDATVGYIHTMAVFAAIIFAGIFSFLVYSRRNIIYSVLISVGIVFPGFFYGLIPGYFAFSLVCAFWVSQFTINMFDSNYIVYMISRANTVPEQKLAKYKLRMFKKQYRRNVRAIKKEIADIVRSPNRNENFLRLDRLALQLEAIKKNNKLFFMIYGLSDLRSVKKRRKKDASASASDSTGRADGAAKKHRTKKEPKEKKEKFLTPVQIEKRRLKEEAKEKAAAEKAGVLLEKKEFAKKPFGERQKIKYTNNLKAKRKYSVRGGYAGFFAFIVAFAAVSAVQPFISEDARLELALPEEILHFLTSTVEYALVGSDSSVYGGYAGGMGGGFLYRPEGARFRDRPILRVSVPPNSGVVYLKGWTGTIYTGNMWLEADKRQIDQYNELREFSGIPRFSYIYDRFFFRTFTESMQEVIAAVSPQRMSPQRRNAELKSDKIAVEHLVSGGRRVFLPYFLENFGSDNFNLRINADLSVEVTNSLFRHPVYTADFYSVDNILNRTPYATEGLREYLDDYRTRLGSPISVPELYSLLEPRELSELMPEIRFLSEREFYNMGNRAFDRLNEAGTFHTYSAPYSDDPVYRGYIYIPYKYEEPDIIALVAARYNFFSSSLGRPGHYINPQFVYSEVLYHNYVREHYLGIPEGFPAEIGELAEKITREANARTDYDKALAIEQYIAEKYFYTLNPMIPANPRGDFVYNFLFDTEQGYCTAYATAMVMMMRTLGIPARYAEGYLVDTGKRRIDDYGNEYIIVYDFDGHAWPEVYLRGIGWIPFEPTVSYSEDPDTEAAPYVFNPSPRLPTPGSFMPMTEPEFEEDDDDFIGRRSASEESFDMPPEFFIVLAVILTLAAVYISNRVIISKRFKNFRSANTNSAVLKMLGYIMLFLRYCGFVMHNEEGMIDFARRVSPGFETITPDGWTAIAGIMQKARYSMHEITEEERASVYEFMQTLRKECLKRLKFSLKFKLRYVYYVL